MSPITWEILQCRSQLKRELFSKYSLGTLRVKGIKHKPDFYIACASKISLISLFWQSAFSVLSIPEAGKQHIFVTKSSTWLNDHLETPNIFSPLLVYRDYSDLQTGSEQFSQEDKQMKELSRFKNHLLFLPPHCQLHWSISGRGPSMRRGIWNKVWGF